MTKAYEGMDATGDEALLLTTIKVQVPVEIDHVLHKLKILKGKSKSVVITAALKDFLKPGCRLLQ